MYVNSLKLIHHINVLVIGLLLLSCATPMAPTGGPADKVGPSVNAMHPNSGTVNYSGDVFEFEFSEYVNRGSFEKALIIEPDLGIQYDVKWKKKKATVKFKDALPDSTTVILTLGAGVTDLKNNKMGNPVKLAISTGDEIDSGEIVGRVRAATDGSSRKEQRVLLYREPLDLTQKAAYSAETDTGGVFRFAYLREGRYHAIMIDDRNQNKTWENTSETARPFNREWIDLEKGSKDTLDVAYWFEADTLRPELQAVGLLSSQKLRLRFSEEIKFTPQINIKITDSLKSEVGRVIPINISKKDPFIAYAFSSEELKSNESYFVAIQGITDFSGNEALTLETPFKGSNQVDTTQQRIIANNGKNGLFPTQAFTVEYAVPIQDQDLIDSVVVVEGDVSFDDWPGISVLDNKLTIPPQGEWIDGVDYQFLMWDPVKRKRQLFTPVTWDPIDFGGVEVKIESSDSAKVYQLLLSDEENIIDIDTTFSGIYTIEDIPSISYTLTVFEDLNENNKWDFGTIVSFKSPEPYYIQRGLKVQKGFTSEILISFK